MTSIISFHRQILSLQVALEVFRQSAKNRAHRFKSHSAGTRSEPRTVNISVSLAWRYVPRGTHLMHLRLSKTELQCVYNFFAKPKVSQTYCDTLSHFLMHHRPWISGQDQSWFGSLCREP